MKPSFDSETSTDLVDPSVGLLSDVEAGSAEKNALYSTIPRRQRFWNFVQKSFQVFIIYLKHFLIFLVPSFLSDKLLLSNDQRRTPRDVRPIAYLDGIRGMAAWFIVNTHLLPVISRTSGAAWSCEGGYWQWWRMPAIRLVYSGPFAIGLFFVIGGWTCSLAAVAAMNGSPRKSGLALEKAAASSFRRPLRLVLPSLVAMIIPFILIRLNFFGALTAKSAEYNIILEGWEQYARWPARNPSFWAQLQDLIRTMGDLFKIWTAESHDSFKLEYYKPLWTIKAELRCSLLLFIVHQALFFIKRRNRLIITSGLTILCFALSSMDMPCFLAGFLIAEYMQANPLIKVNKSALRSFGWWVVFVLGLYLGSYPSWNDLKTPTHAWLRPLAPFRFEPHDRFFIYVGAALFVLSVSRLPIMMRLFSCPLALYLGRISFALYLVHYWVVHLVGANAFYYAWLWTGEDNKAQTYLGFIVAYPIVLFCSIWAGDIFARAVEAPLANLTVKVQKWLFTET